MKVIKEYKVDETEAKIKYRKAHFIRYLMRNGYKCVIDRKDEELKESNIVIKEIESSGFVLIASP